MLPDGVFFAALAAIGVYAVRSPAEVAPRSATEPATV